MPRNEGNYRVFGRRVNAESWRRTPLAWCGQCSRGRRHGSRAAWWNMVLKFEDLKVLPPTRYKKKEQEKQRR
jgi:hypothetical protein